MTAHSRCVDLQIFAVSVLVYLLKSYDPDSAELTDHDADTLMQTVRALRVAVECMHLPSAETQHAHSRGAPDAERLGFANAAVQIILLVLHRCGERPTPAAVIARRDALLHGSGARQLLLLVHLSMSKGARDAENQMCAMWALFYLTANTAPIRTAAELEALRDEAHPANIAATLGFAGLVMEALVAHGEEHEELVNAGRACMDPEYAFAMACHLTGRLSAPGRF